MSNFTKIERYLNDIERHLKIIAENMNSQQDTKIFNTVSNLYHSLDEVVLVEAEKVFAGLKFSVYLQDADQSDDELLKKLEEFESLIHNEHPNANISISYIPIDE